MNILTDKTTTKTRKTSLMRSLLGTDLAKIVSDMTLVQLQNLQNAVHRISDSHVFSKIHDKINDQGVIMNTEVTTVVTRRT